MCVFINLLRDTTTIAHRSQSGGNSHHQLGIFFQGTFDFIIIAFVMFIN